MRVCLAVLGMNRFSNFECNDLEDGGTMQLASLSRYASAEVCCFCGLSLSLSLSLSLYPSLSLSLSLPLSLSLSLPVVGSNGFITIGTKM